MLDVGSGVNYPFIVAATRFKFACYWTFYSHGPGVEKVDGNRCRS